MKYIKLTALALTLCLLCGCSFMPFTTPEEQQAALQAAEEARKELEEQLDPALALQEDLKLRKTLTNSQGVVLAEYEVDLPYFSKTDKKSQSFERINDYYFNEISGLSQDADSLFSAVKAAYGEGWDTVTEAAQPYSVTIGYELLEAPAGYLCIRCDYDIRENGQREQYSQAQVFLLDNGWRLTLETLLGEDFETAAPQILAAILQWCQGKNIDVTAPETRTLAEFSENYALTAEGFVFYTQPFQLNNKNATRYTIPVSLNPYRGMLDLK